MTICFVRHGKLKEPFDSYDDLNLSELDDLATQQIDPGIDIKEAHVVNWLVGAIRGASSLNAYCATSRRAKQTSEKILEQADKDIEPVPTDLLNEIRFSPSALTNSERYKKSGMRVIRTNLFEAILNGSDSVESLDDIFERIKKLDALLTSQNIDCALCVTHGFYMRFLEMYFKHNITESSQVTKELITQQPNRPNLRGFKIVR